MPNNSIKYFILAASISTLVSASTTFAEEEGGITSGLMNMVQSKYDNRSDDDVVDGSVVPKLTMAEQILPCLNATDNVTRILVNVSGVQSQEGNLRVMIYGSNPDEFLVSGKGVKRVDVPSQIGDMQVCMELPSEGTYSMAVLHDRNANGRVEVFSDGFGFSNNPSLGFSVPDYEEVSFQTASGLQEMQVALNYLFNTDKTERRRRSRR
jgi:uncharacterized protein (DUF2141 family)